MRINRLTLAALAWASLAVAGASAQRAIRVQPVQAPPPPGANQPVKEPVLANDPSEPAMQVEVSYNNVYAARGGATGGTKIEVDSGAKGTTLKVPSQGGYSGSAQLTFKNSAPPMRFTTRLTGMQNYDLSSMTLTSGSLTLQVGSVGTSATTKYFDAKGKELSGPTGAAFTVRAKRDNGQVDIEMRRGAGATLGKTVSVTWQTNTNNIEFGFKRRLGG